MGQPNSPYSTADQLNGPCRINGAAVLNEALGRLYHPAETRSSLRQFKPGATKSGLYHAVYELAAAVKQRMLANEAAPLATTATSP